MMKEAKCPLCDKGRIVIKRGSKVLGEIKCPLCEGRGSIHVVEPSDVVDVEVMMSGSKYEHVIVHKKDTLNPRYRDARMTVEEVFKRWREVNFCSYCFGEYIIYKDKLIKTY